MLTLREAFASSVKVQVLCGMELSKRNILESVQNVAKKSKLAIMFLEMIQAISRVLLAVVAIKKALQLS